MHHMEHIWTMVMLKICKHTFYAYLSRIWKLMQFTHFIRKVLATKILLSGKFSFFLTLNEWGASSEDKGRESANTTLSSPHSQKIAHHRRQLHKGSLQPRVRQVCALWNLSNSGKLSGRWGMQWGQRWWWEERCRSSLCAALCALHKASVTTSDSSPGRSLAASERSRWQRSWLPGKVGKSDRWQIPKVLHFCTVHSLKVIFEML